MNLTNPLDQDITVQIKGETYTLPAKGTLKGLEKETALFWKERLHPFLEISDGVPVKVETKEKEEKLKTK